MLLEEVTQQLLIHSRLIHHLVLASVIYQTSILEAVLTYRGVPKRATKLNRFEEHWLRLLQAQVAP